MRNIAAYWPLVAVMAAISSGCASGDSPELACQKRIAAAAGEAPRGAPAVAKESEAPADAFNSKAYAAIDRNGCTAGQLGQIDRLASLTAELTGLLEANERAGKAGGTAEHMAAFERMNDALVQLNNRQQVVRLDLARMMEAQ